MFVVMYDLRAMPAGHQTFLRQRTFSVPVRRDPNNPTSKRTLTLGQGRTLRYLVHLRWAGCSLFFKISACDTISLPCPCFCFRFQSSKSGKIYLHRDIRLLFSRKSMEVDSGAAYELQSFTETPMDPPFSPRCWSPTPSLPPPPSRPLRKLQSPLKASDRLFFSPSDCGFCWKEMRFKDCSQKPLSSPVCRNFSRHLCHLNWQKGVS